MTSSLTEARATWDYAASVERVKPMVVKWGTLTVDLLHELCQARDALSRTGVYPREGGANASPLKTWGRYCLDVGLTKSTVNRWLLRYDDETRTVQELPEPTNVTETEPAPSAPEAPQDAVVDAEPAVAPGTNGKRTRLDPERQAKVDKFSARMAAESRAGPARAPEPETSRSEMGDLLQRIDDQILRMQEAAKRFSHLTLSGGSDDMVQASMLDLTQRYVLSFESATRRVEVAHNLIKALRVLIHEVNGEEASA